MKLINVREKIQSEYMVFDVLDVDCIRFLNMSSTNYHTYSSKCFSADSVIFFSNYLNIDFVESYDELCYTFDAIKEDLNQECELQSEEFATMFLTRLMLGGI